MKIQVTKEHIKNGSVWRGDSCPVALAIREQTQFKEALVGIGDFDTDADADRQIALPLETQQFIEAFDAEKKVLPFEFEIDV